jgi:hypothetical protein
MDASQINITPSGICPDIGPFVEMHPDTLHHGALDWAMAQAEGVDVYISGKGSCWLSDKPKQLYSPHTRFRQGGRLLDAYDAQLSTSAISGARMVTVHGCQGTGPDTLTALCRAIVLHKLGTLVKIPLVLAQVRSGESLPDHQKAA